MPKEFTYTDAGVNRQQRHESKKALELLKETYQFSHFGRVMHLPYSNIFQFSTDKFLDLTIEGVGTKVLLAQLAGKYDTIGVDAVAMAVNDVIRSGAMPLAISDNIHAQASNPKLVRAWLEGIIEGAKQSLCPVVSGEIGDVAEIINGLSEGTGFDMIVAAIGQVSKDKIITGHNIKADDPIIALPSSGLHSNGVTLARKILLKKWGGKYDPSDKPEGLSRDLISEMLEPTKIYVQPLLKVAEAVRIKAAVHITGDAYLKFTNIAKFSTGIGFMFDNFKPHPIFGLIQKTAMALGYTITDAEMFKTFNMGWGFAIIVDKADKDEALAVLDKAQAKPEQIGKVTAEPQVTIHYKNKKIKLA
ncbi:MAG: phosphoribosylformylglycinamidine cyclo-ligase [Candidatus Bathyarchaeota archaeon]|nr:phosphoribosylformylglycinamidine cyclo-ligase [Candidatus Bathyarchaeota archaeon]